MSENRFYLPTFYKTDEQICTTNPQQEWYIDDSWKNKCLIQNNKSWWLEKKYGRTRIDAESFKYNDEDAVWEGRPTKDDNPSSFRINVATTTSILKEVNIDGKKKNVAWNNKAQIKYIKDNASENKLSWRNFISQGHLIDKNDFRNFEATIYWRQIGDWKNEPDDPYKDKRKCKGQPDQMTIYGRGGLHDKGWPNGCLGCCYKGSFDYDKFEKRKSKFGPGSSYFEKEYHHYEGSEGYADRIYQERSRFAYSGTKDDPFGINSPIDINNKWVGKKVLVYDTNEEIENGIYTVRCEVWVDKNAEQSIHDPSMQNWQLMNVFIDKGDEFPPKERSDEMVTQCDCLSKTQIFAWGGPLVSFRIDCTDVQVKYASIREIMKPKEDPPVPC